MVDFSVRVTMVAPKMANLLFSTFTQIYASNLLNPFPVLCFDIVDCQT